MSSPAASSSARAAARISCPCGSESLFSAIDPVELSSSISPKARMTTLSNSESDSSACGFSTASGRATTSVGVASTGVAGVDSASVSSAADAVSLAGVSLASVVSPVAAASAVSADSSSAGAACSGLCDDSSTESLMVMASITASMVSVSIRPEQQSGHRQPAHQTRRAQASGYNSPAGPPRHRP